MEQMKMYNRSAKTSKNSITELPTKRFTPTPRGLEVHDGILHVTRVNLQVSALG